MLDNALCVKVFPSISEHWLAVLRVLAVAAVSLVFIIKLELEEKPCLSRRAVWEHGVGVELSDG
jgi:hypothetical protein